MENELKEISAALNRIADSIYDLGLGRGQSTGAILHLTDVFERLANKRTVVLESCLEDMSDSIASIKVK